MRIEERFEAFQRNKQVTDRAQILSNFALASASNGDWPKAIAQLKEALEICQECRSRGDLHKNLGLIYCRSGDIKNGQQQLSLARTLKPNDPDVLKSLKILEALQKKQMGDH